MKAAKSGREATRGELHRRAPQLLLLLMLHDLNEGDLTDLTSSDDDDDDDNNAHHSAAVLLLQKGISTLNDRTEGERERERERVAFGVFVVVVVC